MKLRIFVLPVGRQRWIWCFKEMFESKVEVPTAHWKTGSSIPQKGTLWAKGIASKARHEARQLETADPTTFKGKAYDFCRRKLLDKLDPVETFLCSIPRSSTSYELVAPDYMDQNEVRRRFVEFLRSRPARHRKMFIAASSLLPITSTVFTLLPGPNIFFLWNAFRTYTHYQSFLGSKHLSHISAPGSYREQQLKNWKQTLRLPKEPGVPVVSLDANLSALLKPCANDDPLDDKALLQLSRGLAFDDIAVKFFKRVQSQELRSKKSTT